MQNIYNNNPEEVISSSNKINGEKYLKKKLEQHSRSSTEKLHTEAEDCVFNAFSKRIPKAFLARCIKFIILSNTLSNV